MRRGGRSALTKEMLLPLSTEKVRSLSLEHHMALAVVRSGNGNSDQVTCLLLRVVYPSFFMRSETHWRPINLSVRDSHAPIGFVRVIGQIALRQIVV